VAAPKILPTEISPEISPCPPASRFICKLFSRNIDVFGVVLAKKHFALGWTRRALAQEPPP
jgi:hypothetical protein